ncbi:MAG: hypothetical protein K940chlam7_01260 [Chlamydiae bacterium]|nr:hypothetical protein [Chlamydiota bacterium]
MHRAAAYFFASCLFFFHSTGGVLLADGEPSTEEECGKSQSTFTAFTGRITRNKVRMRLQPSLESSPIRELDREDLIVVDDETDGFYAVLPPSDLKAYIYRTYVLDGVVEGNRVNIRLDPHTEAPVIAQLNAGYRIDGKISSQNSKWLEITPPPSTRFYVSSDYIEKVGDGKFLTRHEERKEDVNNILNSTYIVSQSELRKSFQEIETEKVVENYQKVINEYTDFPLQVTRAKGFLTKFQDAYLHKKVEYLEARTNVTPNTRQVRRERPSSNNKQPQTEQLAKLERQLQEDQPLQNASQIYEQWISAKYNAEINARMALWIPIEIAYYEQWAKNHDNRSIQEFYKSQQHDAVKLRGILEAYDRPIRNKPGDYLLVNRVNRLPIAYIYSTQINLQDKLGQEISVDGVLRPNNNFAFPAYFILSSE